MSAVERSNNDVGGSVIEMAEHELMVRSRGYLRGLDDLVRQGKVNYVAFSDTPDYIVAEANVRADLMGWSRFIGMQIPYSLLDRAVERAIIPMAKHWDMAVLPWGLLEAGILTGKFLKKVKDPTRIDQKELKLRENIGRSRSEP